MSRRLSPRRAALLAAALILTLVAFGPGLGTPAQAYDPTVGISGSVRDASGTVIPGTAFLLDGYNGSVEGESANDDDGFSFGPLWPGQYAFRFESASAGLTFSALVHTSNDFSFTVPAAVGADIVVAGADTQPVTGLTMQYDAEATGVEIGSGVTAVVASSGTVSDTDGHFAPLLFGASTVTYTLSNGFSGGPITIGPGEQATVVLPDTPSEPRNVTATAGDGKVKLTWDPPAYDGGSPITGYTATASRNSSNFKANFAADAPSGAIRSLPKGKTYTVTLVAKNANGAGQGSAALSVTLPAVDPPTTTTTSPDAGGGGGDPLGGAGSGGDRTGTVPTTSGRSGYWLLGADGAVFSFGDAAPHGDASAALAAANSTAPARAIDIEPTPSGQGYWILDSRGRVRPFGDASHFGDLVLGRLASGEEPASLSATPTGAGYWVFTSRGRTVPFGDAAFLGDVSATPLNGPVLDSIATPSGKGYYMVASDGGIFAFGDARFAGSMGGRRLNAPVRSLVPDGDGDGYWLVASDGGVFAFDAPFRGSLGGVKLNKPVTGMVRYGNGYVMVAEDGGIFAFSDKQFSGSLGAAPPASQIVSVGALG